MTGRKGGVFMRFEITGKAAHSGANFEAGISAINELAHKTLALHALSDPQKGITLNVGVVSGGQTVNTMAPGRRARSICASSRRSSAPRRWRRSKRSWRRASCPARRAKLEISGEFLPLVETPDGKALFEHYAAALKRARQRAGAMFTGGCADSGFASATGTPTICAVGPVGGKGHSPEEYMEVDTLVPRAQALALAILRLPLKGGGQWSAPSFECRGEAECVRRVIVAVDGQDAVARNKRPR